MKRALFIWWSVLLLWSVPSPVHARSMEPDFYEMFDNHGSIMLLINSDTGEIAYANQAAADFYGYGRETLQNMRISDINTLGPEKTAAEMQLAVQEKRNHFVFQHQVADGSVRTVEVYSYPYLYGDHPMLFSIIHDVTAKTLLEEEAKRDARFRQCMLVGIILLLGAFSLALYRSRKKIDNARVLRQTFMDADNGLIYLKDENGRYVFVNKAMERFYQREAEEIIGRDDYDLTSREFADKRRQTDQAALEKKVLVVDEVRWEGKVYKTTKFPVDLANGKVGVGAYIKDVTEEVQHRLEREKSLKRNKILAQVFGREFASTQEQLDYALQEAVRMTESRFGYLFLYDDRQQAFSIHSWSKEVLGDCRKAAQASMEALDKTDIWENAVHQPGPVIMNRMPEPEGQGGKPGAGHPDIRRFMSVPVLVEGRIVAVAGLANKPEDYNENDVYQMSALMKGVWNARDKKEAELKLASEREKYLKTLLSIGDGVLVTDGEGRVEMLNAVAEKLTGWQSGEARGKSYREVFALSHASLAEEINDPVQEVFETDSVRELASHAVITSREGKRHHIEDSAAPIHGKDGEITGVVLVFRDVTEKKEQRQEIEYLSFHDPLTDLYNRRFFQEEVRRLDTKRNLPLTVVIGDVNGLKLTNDVFGHDAGDTLLKRMAEIFKRSCRADDIIARWGGDEFILLLPRTTSEAAGDIVRRIQVEAAREQMQAIRCGVSMGWRSKEHMEEKIENVMDDAEDAMYLQKALDRKNSQEDMLDGILKTLHEAIPREKGHGERTCRFARAIGQALDLHPSELRRLGTAARLHDIGKVGLEMEQHPVVGYRILNAFDGTMDLAEAVLSHHERWDGTGYPKGLAGEEIPQLSRIIAIAEAYDNLVRSVGRKKALEEIQAGAGSLFDPELTELAVRVLGREEK
ncbi:PAS domain-containing protein [Anaerotalea alkaliphila]|uniref:PAS domain-containing protein n=1 Tax=Anaerotalea alkaliphila TaxID=2662126 RepID=A0A7X5HV17_9FIRM|nr:PAS domain-containing protein [Anaerotalea alkaliphila]NDL67161.1 PAS domain-containing protein [Anaerotalea alkaliphila]